MSGSTHGSMSRRSPSILVTDSRHGAHRTAPFVRNQGFARGRQQQQQQQRSGSEASTTGASSQSGRFDNISIDNILSEVSEIPSAQRRTHVLRPDESSTSSPMARLSSAAQSRQQQQPSASQQAGNMNTNTTSNTAQPAQSKLPRLKPHMQGRTTRVSEKLVLIPEEGKPQFKFDDEDESDDDSKPPRPRPVHEKISDGRRSYAERLPRDRRHDLGRVTAYCISDAVRLKSAAEFLRENHKIRPRVYDEALFAPYYLPLLPGDQSRVKSSPGGLAIMERLINESEQGDHHYEFFSGREGNDDDQVEAHNMHDGWTEEGEEFDPSEPQDFSPPTKNNEWLDSERERDLEQAQAEAEQGKQEGGEGGEEGHEDIPLAPDSPPLAPQEEEIAEIVRQDDSVDKPGPPPNDKHAEMFIFTYGVVVFWNFSEKQEKDILADLTFARVSSKPLAVRPVDDQDIETEELHFTYSPETAKPRIYNDMFTLKSGDHMIKLAMSHAVAQSTKLSRFEARMDVNMHDVKHVPKMLALTGKLGLKREEILKISGKLFKLRVDVNLSSNVLDTPEFFWEDEPSLNPLYTAVREYLEIEQRILVLNERCKVFLELTDIIADSIAEGNMSRITWIIIILIALSLGVTMLEIFIRYLILETRE